MKCIKIISIIVISFIIGFLCSHIICESEIKTIQKELQWSKDANVLKLKGIQYFEQYIDASESFLDKLAEDPTTHFDDVWSETPEIELMEDALYKLDSLLTSEL